MANFDTVSAITGPGTSRGQVNTLTLASATETLFAVGTDTTGTTAVCSITVPTGNATSNTLVGAGSPVEYNQNSAISSQSYGRKSGVFTEAPYFSATTFDSGRPFKIRVVGTAVVNKVTTTAVTNSVVISLYSGSAITATYKVATVTAGISNSSTTANSTGQFLLEALVQWDSTTQKLSGYFDGQVGNTLTAPTALSNAAPVTTAAGLVFAPTATFGHVEGGSVSISEIAVDQV